MGKILVGEMKNCSFRDRKGGKKKAISRMNRERKKSGGDVGNGEFANFCKVDATAPGKAASYFSLPIPRLGAF